MRVVPTLTGVISHRASVVRGASALTGSSPTRVNVHPISERAGLMALGAGFVLLAHQPGRKKY
jgi:hypothetical protein